MKVFESTLAAEEQSIAAVRASGKLSVDQRLEAVCQAVRSAAERCLPVASGGPRKKWINDSAWRLSSFRRFLINGMLRRRAGRRVALLKAAFAGLAGGVQRVRFLL